MEVLIAVIILRVSGKNLGAEVLYSFSFMSPKREPSTVANSGHVPGQHNRPYARFYGLKEISFQ